MSNTEKNDSQIEKLLAAIEIQQKTLARQTDLVEKRFCMLEESLRIANLENCKRAEEIQKLVNILPGSYVDSRGSRNQKSVDPHEEPTDDELYRSFPQVPDAPAANTDDTETSRTPTLRAHDAIRYIPTLNGDDDIGVEDFIKEIKSLQTMCIEPTLLLKAIKVEKIVGKAAQSIRNLNLETYGELYEALRSNVATQASSDEYQEQLREVKQGLTESVQSYNIRFRRVLNKLTYAITNEYPAPLPRRLMLESATKKATRFYINGLRREIGSMIFTSKPSNLIDAEKEAADIERYIREERSEALRRSRPAIARPPSLQDKKYQAFTQPRPQLAQSTPSPRPNMFAQTERRPLLDRSQIKCFKCGKIGHTSNQCGNFHPRGPNDRGPPRIHNNTEETDPYETTQYESTQSPDNFQPLDSNPPPEDPVYFSLTQEQESIYYDEEP